MWRRPFGPGIEALNGPILVTGAAGFIGMHVALALLDRGERVVGVDNLDPYYDVKLKEARLERLLARGEAFTFVHADVGERDAVDEVFAKHAPVRVVHLAAQAGVRHSLKHPHKYVRDNVSGFLHILEGCRHGNTAHLVYASSSSVYGLNERLPFAVTDAVNHPASLYAATKKSNELMAHTYSHLFGLATTGLRFFTVYGPWGRPDMALFLFTDAILSGRPIHVFNHGDMTRDFTYIADAVEAIVRVLDRPAAPDPGFDPQSPHPGRSSAPYRVYNVGNLRPIKLTRFIDLIEEELGLEAIRQLEPMQLGDVKAAYSEVEDLYQAVGLKTQTTVQEGIRRFVAWYRSYYGR
ncbi:MAG: NAD-dependent epimerase [Planctomycetota bacterium]|jgi:UDP-glucuronate 4-epimerase